MTDQVTVVGIDAHESRSLLNAGDAVLIDVREENEWAAERIPGASLYPLSRFDADAPAGDPGKIGIFHCRSGRRTAEHFGQFLKTNFKKVVHMDGGILDWKAQGYPTESGEPETAQAGGSGDTVSGITKRYRLLTGPDDRSFCDRVTEALNNGWQLYGSPSATFDGNRVVCAQAVIREEAAASGLHFAHF